MKTKLVLLCLLLFAIPTMAGTKDKDAVIPSEHPLKNIYVDVPTSTLADPQIVIITREVVIDFSCIPAPGNPPTGLVRLYCDSGTGNLTCLTSSGGSCLSGGGGATTFDLIGSGTNITAAMLVGTGASLAATGSGTITATAAPFSGLTGSLLLAQTPLTTVGDTLSVGAGPVLARVPNGITGSIYTATNAALPAFTPPGLAGRSIAGTTDTILCDSGTTIRDRASTEQYTSGSAVAVTLPQAGSSGCSNNFATRVFPTGAGAVTVTPTTSTINGQATLVPSQNTNCLISSPDNANYIAECGNWVKAGANLTAVFNADGSTTFSGNAGTVTSAVIAGTANQVTASGTCTITTSGTCTLSLSNAVVLGTDNSAAGTLQLANSAANAHTILSSGATTTNTIAGFTVVPTTGDLVSCTSASTTCTLTDSGVLAANVLTTASNVPINKVVSATGAIATIADGNNPLTLTCAQTTDAQDCVAFNEASAATNGTLTNGLANQAQFEVSTATNSTATAMEVTQGSITNTIATPIAQFESTYNNASLTGAGVIISVTNTSSATASKLFQVLGGAAGATVELTVRQDGLITTGGALSLGGNTISEAIANANFTVQQGQDGSNAGAQGTLTLRGADTSNNAASNTAGLVAIRGGNETGGTGATEAGGTVTINGGNVSSTAATGVPGTVTITGGALVGAATNTPGADVFFQGGLGTGNATPSHAKIQVPAFVSASGTGAQSLVTRYVTHAKAGSTSSATPTNMFNIPVAANQTIGVEVIVHVETTQATPHNCSTTENFLASVQNTGGTVTQQSTAGTIGTICDTGTLTIAVAFSAATPSVFSVTPSWTVIAPSAVIITVEIHNLSQQDITLL